MAFDNLSKKAGALKDATLKEAEEYVEGFWHKYGVYIIVGVSCMAVGMFLVWMM